MGPINIKTDTQGALDLTINAQFSQKTKHINIWYYFIRDHINTKDIKLNYVPTDEIIADIFTKPLPKPAFKKLRIKLGIFSLTDIEPRL